MTTTDEVSVYTAAGGLEGLQRLADAWHRRCLADPVAEHPFSHGDLHPQHTDRLAAYWAEALGGPAAYTQELGDHEGVQRMHAGNGEHDELDEAAIACFAAALDDADLPDDPRLKSTLLAYFRWSTEQLARFPDGADDVPPDEPFPHWSWAGRVD